MSLAQTERGNVRGGGGGIKLNKETLGMEDPTSMLRLQRNLAEKQRRDKLNGYIRQLAATVPMITKTDKRLDKISILRLTAAHLRLHFSTLNLKKSHRIPPLLPDAIKANLNVLQKALEGFLMITNCVGKIVFTSLTVEKYLGHQDIDLIGHSIYHFIHESDIPVVQSEFENLFKNSQKCPSSDVRSRFTVLMRERIRTRKEEASYCTMLFSCHLNWEESETLRLTKGCNVESNTLVKIFIQPLRYSPQNEMTLTEAFQDEYITTHGLKAEILSVDHRISTITGHLPSEVRGMSAYQYILSSDVPVALFAQKLMFSSNSGKGIIVYRLRTRNDSYIYMQSIGHVEYNNSLHISHFVCINKLLSDEEGSAKLKEFHERFMPYVKGMVKESDSLEVSCSTTDFLQESSPGFVDPELENDTAYKRKLEFGNDAENACKKSKNLGYVESTMTQGIDQSPVTYNTNTFFPENGDYFLGDWQLTPPQSDTSPRCSPECAQPDNLSGNFFGNDQMISDLLSSIEFMA